MHSAAVIALAALALGADGTRELLGRVVRTGPAIVYLEHMGAVVPFKVTRGTEFTGLGAKASADLAEGQQVLATFRVEGTTNVATRFAATSEAVDSARRGGSRPSPGRPPDVPAPPDHGPAVPRVPPGEGVPRDPGVPLPR